MTPGMLRHKCCFEAHQTSRHTRLTLFDAEDVSTVSSLTQINQPQQTTKTCPKELEESSGRGDTWYSFMSTVIKKITKNSRRKRFNDDQIKSLETTFESEARPELHLKQHLANKLGLQPRQVAIWFQNKRARSKSKQIEREYSVLKSNYDNLALQFEALRKENQALLIQVQKLRKMADSNDGEENDKKNQIKLADINSHEVCMPLCGEANIRTDYLEEADVLNMVQIAENSLASPENGCSLESCTFFDNTCGSAQWWDF